jgi:hypothetical protein
MKLFVSEAGISYTGQRQWRCPTFSAIMEAMKAMLQELDSDRLRNDLTLLPRP